MTVALGLMEGLRDEAASDGRWIGGVDIGPCVHLFPAGLLTVSEGLGFPEHVRASGYHVRIDTPGWTSLRPAQHKDSPESYSRTGLDLVEELP